MRRKEIVGRKKVREDRKEEEQGREGGRKEVMVDNVSWK